MKHRIKKVVTETASAGAVGAGAIAARYDPIGTQNTQDSLLKLMLKFYKNTQNRLNIKPVTPFPIRITEQFDVNDVLSRLKGIDGSKYDSGNSVTFGVEDDDGNTMKVTVRKDQAKEFEERLGDSLYDKETFKKTGYKGLDVSLAELLFSLKNEFDILDVEFPEIPKDAVYNADKATYNVPDTGTLQQPDNVDELSEPLTTGIDAELPTEPSGEPGEESVEDKGIEDTEKYTEEPAQSDEKSILQSVLSMLRSQAEAEKAKADAEAEKSRALQAEYSARAADATIAKEEEFVRMESEIGKQKEKEKEAKRLADLAKYRASRATASESSAPPSLKTFLYEFDEFDTEATLRRQRSMIRQKFAPTPADDQATRQHKAQQMQLAMREIDTKLRRTRIKSRFDQTQNKDKTPPTQNKQDDASNNQANQQDAKPSGRIQPVTPQRPTIATSPQ